MKYTDKKISCIVCAFNEESRIGEVLKILSVHPLLDEVIVVNDASTDNTKDVVAKFENVKLISLTNNIGKSATMATGIEQSENEILMFIDADLKGLTIENISDLAEPVLGEYADMSISLRNNSLLIYKLIGLDFVSGERVYSKKLIQDELEKMKALPGFGIEVFINELVIKHKLRVKVVNWKNVLAIRKSDKMGEDKKIKFTADLAMVKEIRKVIPYSRMIYQIFKIISQKV